MLKKLLSLPEFVASARPYRSKYGLVEGMRMALAVRRAAYAARPGTSVLIDVPGLRSPITLRAGTSDASVFRQIFIRDDLDFELGPEPAFIVDAGAYIGISSVFLSWRYPSAQVVALELERSNFDLLKTNTSSYPRITPMHKGLWWRSGRLTVANPYAAQWSFTAREASEDDSEPVEGISVLDLLTYSGRETIDLMKIDIEGGEKDLFSRNADAWLDRVRVIAIELHDRVRPGCSEALRLAIAGRSFRQSEHGEYRVLVRM